MEPSCHIQMAYGPWRWKVEFQPNLFFATGKDRPQSSWVETDFLGDSRNLFQVYGQWRRDRLGRKIVLRLLNKPLDGNGLFPM
ncbi:MAG: hypothetical protein ACXV5R_01520 [Candidatus Angelobacter sp.]